MCMKISKEDLLRINKGFGGNLRSDFSLDFAIEKQEDKKLGEYKKLAYLWRAILVDHPFSDGNFRILPKYKNSDSSRKSLDFRNKRTATFFVLAFTEENKKYADRDLLVHHVLSIAKNNIADIRKIEWRLKTCIN